MTSQKISIAQRVAGRWVGRVALLGPMPRSSYLPPAVRNTPPIQPEGTDISYWTWEENGKPYGILFVGKAQKPMFYYRFPTEAHRERMIREAIKDRKGYVERVQQRQQERKQFQHSFKEGDILVSHWGYDQTNVNWYEVTEIRGKAVVIREIGSRIIGGHGGPTEEVMPIPRHYTGKPMLKIPRQGGCITLTSYSSACLWDGKPQYETGASWGH